MRAIQIQIRREAPVVCNATAIPFNLIEPNTIFEDGIDQTDLRLAKTVRFRGGVRLNASTAAGDSRRTPGEIRGPIDLLTGPIHER